MTARTQLWLEAVPPGWADIQPGAIESHAGWSRRKNEQLFGTRIPSGTKVCTRIVNLSSKYLRGELGEFDLAIECEQRDRAKLKQSLYEPGKDVTMRNRKGQAVMECLPILGDVPARVYNARVLYAG